MIPSTDPSGQLDPTGQLESTLPAVPDRDSLLLLNHQREPVDELVDALAGAGYSVEVSEALAESSELLDTRGDRFDVVLWNPLSPRLDGVELEMLECMQSEDRVVPVVILVEDPTAVGSRTHSGLDCFDFVTKPVRPVELLVRLRLAASRRRRLHHLRDRARTLEGQVTLDFKTELLSEQHFRRLLEIEFKRARRHGHPLSLMLVDIDDFKSVNDSTDYGFGDDVLRHVARVLKGNVRETDFAARFGGDEFAVLLPHTKPAQAVQTALRMRSRVQDEMVRSGGYERSVTISIGIDTYDGRIESTPQELRRNANKALHQAKRRGKNQAWLYARDLSESEEMDEGAV